MVKHTQTIRRQFANLQFAIVFDHFVGLALKGLRSQILLVVLIWAVQVWFCDPTIELTARIWAVLHLK